MTTVQLERRGAIAIVTLNRPDCLNAISDRLLTDFQARLDEAAGDAQARVLVLRAAGRAFCAGDDLNELAQAEYDEDLAKDFIGRLQNITRSLMLGRQTVICAVQGYVVGGGVAWPLNADFTVFADDAVLFTPEATHGLFASGGTTLLLARRCGQEAANRILHFGDRIDAAGLLRMGIAGEVVPSGSLERRTMELAEQLCALPPESLIRLKAANADLIRDALEQALAIESVHCIEASLDAAARARAAQKLSRA
ncbi:MAG: enoyl-CoA hydratase/isomerase family protein [Hyphomonadaceae bacterium]|nr:enoyl-CoA hydratase/isomerase family protein [Hyphomonadaceae bacterium]